VVRMSCMMTRNTASRMHLLGIGAGYVGDDLNIHGESDEILYPFHSDTLNIETPQYIVEACKQGLDEKKTKSFDPAGTPTLREVIAKKVGESRGVVFDQQEVSIQSGGKAIIKKFLSACMEEGEEVLYPSAGYPHYSKLIKYMGGVPVPYPFKETERGFTVDIEQLKKIVSHNSRVFIFNHHQNPLGVSLDDQQMKQIARLCVEHDLWVLSDETFFDLVYDGDARSIIACEGMKERTVILYSFSKTYCMTGFRLAAALGPLEVIQCFNKLNANGDACPPYFVQHAGVTALNSMLSAVHVNSTRRLLQKRRDLLVEMLNQIPGFVAHVPASAFYVTANVTAALRMIQVSKLEDFRRMALKKAGIAFSTCEKPLSQTQKFVSFGFAGLQLDQIREGMDKLRYFIESGIAQANTANGRGGTPQL